MIRQSQRNSDLHLPHIGRTYMQNKYRSEYGKTGRAACKEGWNVKGSQLGLAACWCTVARLSARLIIPSRRRF
jgi:hypothetical protein